MKKAWLALIFGSALVLAACGGGDEAGNNGTGETAVSEGETLVKESCVMCHGGNLEGRNNAPAIADVGSRLSEEEILDIILNGRNQMPPGALKGEEAEAAAEWLATQK